MIFTGLTAVVPLRDPPAMVSPYGRVMALAKQWASREKTDSPVPGKMDFSSPRLEQFSFGGSDVYCLNCGVFAPAWCMTKSRMVASLSPQNVKAYLCAAIDASQSTNSRGLPSFSRATIGRRWWLTPILPACSSCSTHG